MAQRIDVKDLNIFYGDFKAVADVGMSVEPRSVTAFIGPSGCGKSTFLRTLNRMHEVIPGAHVQGSVAMDGVDLYGSDVDPVAVRRQVGMVFQRPNPFPTMSIAENVLAGIKLNNKRISKSRRRGGGGAARCASANLWNEVKDRLNRPGSGLSGGQQQRLCIARAIAVKPQVLLMDEPCSALDPISTLAIEDLIAELKADYTIVIVTHNMQQAARVSDRTAFFNLAATGRAGPPGRDRRHVDDLLLAARAGHGGLHLGPLRLSPHTHEGAVRPGRPLRRPVSPRRGPWAPATRTRAGCRRARAPARRCEPSSGVEMVTGHQAARRGVDRTGTITSADALGLGVADRRAARSPSGPARRSAPRRRSASVTERSSVPSLMSPPERARARPSPRRRPAGCCRARRRA